MSPVSIALYSSALLSFNMADFAIANLSHMSKYKHMQPHFILKVCMYRGIMGLHSKPGEMCMKLYDFLNTLLFDAFITAEYTM